MKNIAYIATVTVMLSACAEQPMRQEEIASISSQELCIKAAQTVITGDPVLVSGRPLTGQIIISELRNRHEACQPLKQYMQIASARVQFEQQQAIIRSQRRNALSSALFNYGQFLQNQQMIQQQQQQNTILQLQNMRSLLPITTRCTNSFGTVNCQSQ